MRQISALTHLITRTIHSWTSPFTASVPADVHDAVILRQSRRLHAVLPLLCLTISAIALAMAIAVIGYLPVWQQVLPPAVIIAACMGALCVSRRPEHLETISQAETQLRRVVPFASIVGLCAGFWCVNAFIETEVYYCMTAPVFIGLGAIVSASCLLSVPRAAIAAMFATALPIFIKMVFFQNLGVRAMAVTLALIIMLQTHLILEKFRDSVALLVMQHRLNGMADTDALTGLANRRLFSRLLSDRLSQRRAVAVILIDLDNFKDANDTYGHHAGDLILKDISSRLTCVASQALCVARIGGDEFAIVFDIDETDKDLLAVSEHLRSTAFRTEIENGQQSEISISFGVARSDADGFQEQLLLQAADKRLYLDKAHIETIGVPTHQDLAIQVIEPAQKVASS